MVVRTSLRASDPMTWVQIPAAPLPKLRNAKCVKADEGEEKSNKTNSTSGGGMAVATSSDIKVAVCEASLGEVLTQYVLNVLFWIAYELYFVVLPQHLQYFVIHPSGKNRTQINALHTDCEKAPKDSNRFLLHPTEN